MSLGLVVHGTKCKGMWQFWVQGDMMSHQLRPLGFMALTSVWSLESAAGHPQWLQGLLGLQWHSQVQCLRLGKVVVVVGASGMHTLVYQLQKR